MLSAHDNELLTRTGPGTPMGEVFRRFWVPACLSEEVPDAGGAPARVRLLGEELLAFRSPGGEVGLIQERCPHRGASLFWGRNEDEGMRCVYHGWKYAPDGRCVEMPSEPPQSRFADKITVAAYPVREAGGIAWAYLGPRDEEVPPLPALEFASVPDDHRYVSKKLQQCNWAQSAEGAIDTAHFSFLHMPLEVPPNAPDSVRWMRADSAPRFTVLLHEAGLLVGASRHADGDELYWRLTQYLVPNHSLAPGALPGQTMVGQTWAPIDDHSCWVYCYAWNPWAPLEPEWVARYEAGFGIFPEPGEGYLPRRNRANDYLIDREEQRTRTFTGIRGISEQDACIQDSQGLIADRTAEHLGTTDIAIIEFRKLMLGLARDLQEGSEPPQARLPEAYRVRSGDVVTAGDARFEDVAWERVMVE